MKYMVIVNEKWIVSMSAETKYEAEDILTNEFGITSAYAFDEHGTRSETFHKYLTECETISFNGLMDMCYQLEADRQEYLKVKEEEEELCAEIDRLNAELANTLTLLDEKKFYLDLVSMDMLISKQEIGML